MKNTTGKRVTNAEFVNGVHPLHWATSPGPSPMGTDPIKSSKMVQLITGTSPTDYETRILCNVLKTTSSGSYKIFNSRKTTTERS